jgi:hypothetical protein
MPDRDQYPTPGVLSGEGHGECLFRLVTVTDAVGRALAGQWEVPEFQREFIWKPAQVCALADSLWRNYPIGALLLWRAAQPGESPLWIADGQQRLTALCLLSGGTPHWFGRKTDAFRARIRQQFDIRFDASARSEPLFVAADKIRNRQGDPSLVPTSRLMAIDPASPGGSNELNRLVRGLRDAGCCRDFEDVALYERLARVSMIRRREMIATLVTHPQRQEVLDIFARLNSRGMSFRRLLLKLVMEEIPAALRGMKGRYQP